MEHGDAAGQDPPSGGGRKEEPLWLVRIVFILFFAGFAAFVANELRQVLEAL